MNGGLKECNEWMHNAWLNIYMYGYIKYNVLQNRLSDEGKSSIFLFKKVKFVFT